MQDTDPMRRENHSKVQVRWIKVNNNGVNFLETGTEVVAVVEAQTLVFPGHGATNHTNDNYLSVPTQLSVKQVRLPVESVTSDCTFFSCVQGSETKIRTDFKRLSLQRGRIKMLSVMFIL